MRGGHNISSHIIIPVVDRAMSTITTTPCRNTTATYVVDICTFIIWVAVVLCGSAYVPSLAFCDEHTSAIFTAGEAHKRPHVYGDVLRTDPTWTGLHDDGADDGAATSAAK
eukprot:scaffold4145_cov55-Attheya_sp.AAC.2